MFILKKNISNQSSEFVNLGITSWGQNGQENIGAEKLIAKCQELNIPYQPGETKNYIIVDKIYFPQLNTSSLNSNCCTVCEYPTRYFTDPKKTGKYLFVSDIHGSCESLVKQLKEIAKNNPPEIVFFLGDIVGTELLDDLQKKFYNVFNSMKTLPENTKKIGSKIIDNAQILIDSLNKICPNSCKASASEMAALVISYQHFGHFVSNLPIEIRQILRKDMSVNAKKIVEAMRKFTRQGKTVVVIEGNWDARTPLDFQVNTKECLPILPNKRIFYLRKFIEKIRNKRIHFVKNNELFETGSYNFQTISFDGVAKYVPGTLTKIKNNKPTILVSHVQADWKAVKKDCPMTDEGEQLSKKIWTVLCDTHPDAMVHGHLHDTLLNEQGQECDGYLYPESNQIKVHYLPLRSQRFINF